MAAIQARSRRLGLSRRFPDGEGMRSHAHETQKVALEQLWVLLVRLLAEKEQERVGSDRAVKGRAPAPGWACARSRPSSGTSRLPAAPAPPARASRSGPWA